MADQGNVPCNSKKGNNFQYKNISTVTRTQVRIIHVNDPFEKCIQYCSNRIVSTRYTWYNFVFKNLFEQFHNVANVYFLLSYITYFFIEGVKDALLLFLPLFLILGLTMTKDGIDDFLRYLDDCKINSINYLALNCSPNKMETKWTLKPASEIVVGDIIRCNKGQSFPCDLIILASGDPFGNVSVSTVNIDGENNVKKRFAIAKTQPLFSSYSSNDLISKNCENTYHFNRQMSLHIICQNPTEEFYKFEGKMTIGNDKTEFSLQPENILLCGCKLMNPKYVIGVAVYTGKETKISINSKPPKRKFSSREPKSNKLLFVFLSITFLLTLILTNLSFAWMRVNKTNTWYLILQSFSAWQYVKASLRFHGVLSYIIPIAIIMTIELQQMILAFFISNDSSMYSKEDNLRSRAKNAQLADELGQVEYLFTDKTGTLTQNIMNLQRIGVVATKVVYTFPSEHKVIEKHPISFKHLESKPHEPSVLTNFPPSMNKETEDSNDYRIHELMWASLASTKDTKPMIDEKYVTDDLKQLLTIVCLCHTVNVTESENEVKDKNNFIYEYESTSPDEKCLIEGTRKFGIVYAGREFDLDEPTSTNLNLDYWSISADHEYQCSVRKQYIVDAILEFDSTRRQMSIMVRHPDKTYHIHSKGAETAILNPKKCSNWCDDLSNTATNMVTGFALNGFRTLVFATRQVKEEMYFNLLAEFFDASKLFGQERIHAQRLIYNKIECDLKPIGVTGVEDRLQNGAKECVEKLREAGIQIWVLTGDKKETAISTSRAVGHLTPEMSLIRITDCEDFQSTARRIFEQLDGLRLRSQQLDDNDNDISYTKSDQSHKMNTIKRLPICNKLSSSDIGKVSDGCYPRSGMADMPVGLIIDGETIQHAIHNTVCPIFLELCMRVNAVIGYRMTPSQKAAVVELVKTGVAKYSKHHRPPVTAAIGDGGNDVAMLTVANIGIGIYGKEGFEAANAADYALTHFKCLERLLLLHGQWSHYRITYTMLIFYHKSIVFVATQLIYIFYNGYSENYPYGDILYILYNLTMTSFICLTYGVFEQYMTEYLLISRPYLYKSIRKQANLKSYYVLLWIIDSIWQSMIVYYMSHFLLAGGFYYTPASFYDSNNKSNGNFDFSLFGCGMYVYTWLTVTLHSIIWIRNMNIMILISIACTLSNIIILLTYQLLAPLEGLEYLSFTKLATSPTFWFGIPLTLVSANLPILLWRIISDAWWTLQLIKKSSNYKPRNYCKRKITWLQALVYDRNVLLKQ